MPLFPSLMSERFNKNFLDSPLTLHYGDSILGVR